LTPCRTTERTVADPRWRVEHAQVLAPVDIPRFGEMSVIASMQPSHAIGDLHFAPSRIGYAAPGRRLCLAAR
jgi:predicted amidohydrolase YtcJ